MPRRAVLLDPLSHAAAARERLRGEAMTQSGRRSKERIYAGVDSGLEEGLKYFLSSTLKFLFAVRLGSKHNIRASILASSLCLDSASMRGGSIKGPGSIISTSVVNGDRGHGGGAPTGNVDCSH